MSSSTFYLLFSSTINLLFSPHFLFLVVMSLLLLKENFNNKTYNILLFFGVFAYFLFFHSNSLRVFQLAGDNICQIAYWKILFQPNLTGSIGASYTKPGQIFLLGPLFDLSMKFGELPFKIGLCLIMAACIWSMVRVATDMGGRVAGLISFFVSFLVFRGEFVAGSFSIFLIPTLFIGLWLYFYRPGHKVLARLLLALSLQFHILAIAALGVVWLINLLKKDWRELFLFSLNLIASLLVWCLVLLRIQGSVERFSLGASAGYLPSNDYLLYSSKTEFLLKTIWTELASSYTVPALLALAAVGIAGSIFYGYRYYLCIFATIALLIVNIAIFGGGINLGRYFSNIYAFSCSVGIGTIVIFLKNTRTKSGRTFTNTALIAMIIFFSIILIKTGTLSSYSGTQPYVRSASHLLDDKNLPAAISLMTEDDLLYPIVVMSPERYHKLTALQYFNAHKQADRITILKQIDYIWIVLNNEHMYYYINHIADSTWMHDPFRLMVNDILLTKQTRSLYDCYFVPVDINRERLLLRVEHRYNS